LESINNSFGLQVNYKWLVRQFLSHVNVFRYFFSLYGIKAVFMSDYYNPRYQAAVYAAKTYGIPTVELQHGTINNVHPAYNLFTELTRASFPDYLFAFGEYVKDVFGHDNPLYLRKNVIPVGSMYIDHINNGYNPSTSTRRRFTNFRKSYGKIVAVSSQWPIEKELISFLKGCAMADPKILYLYIPRDLAKDYSSLELPDNIIIFKDLDIYRAISQSDFHATVFSTCALEAPALGVPNILIDINGLAKKEYGRILTDVQTTRYSDDEQGFVDIINNWKVISRDDIRSKHDGFFKRNYRDNLVEALKISKIKDGI